MPPYTLSPEGLSGRQCHASILLKAKLRSMVENRAQGKGHRERAREHFFEVWLLETAKQEVHARSN